MLEAMYCRLLAVCSVRTLRSWLPRAISLEATEMLCVALLISPSVDCSTVAKRFSECNRLPSRAGGMLTAKLPSASAAKATLDADGSPPSTRRAVRRIQTVNPIQVTTQIAVSNAVSCSPRIK